MNGETASQREPGLSLAELRGLSDPGTGARGLDRGIDDLRARLAGGAPEPVARPPLAVDARERAIVDEAFLRGASAEEVVGLMSARAKLQGGRPASLDAEWLRAGRPAAVRAPNRRLGLEGLYSLTERDIQADRLEEERRRFVMARYIAYVELVRAEFADLTDFAREQFTPIVDPPYVDPYATAEEKYRGMRGAYYRAGYAFFKRDFLKLIRPASFFGSPIPTGVHQELAIVLKAVEKDIAGRKPDLDKWLRAGQFRIGGFVPRFQAGSNKLSNHAFGLAIDIDAAWNPQVKKGKDKADAMKALLQATGERFDVDFGYKGSGSVQQTHDRLAKASAKLMDWLSRHLKRYDDLQREIAKVQDDAKQKEKYAELRKKLDSDRDLAALDTLVRIYSRRVILQWKEYGIISIPPGLIQSFISQGQRNEPRWGGEYTESKDSMHLELLRLADPKSLARPNGPGRRSKVYDGIDDLYAPGARATPVNGPP